MTNIIQIGLLRYVIPLKRNDTSLVFFFRTQKRMYVCMYVYTNKKTLPFDNLEKTRNLPGSWQ